MKRRTLGTSQQQISFSEEHFDLLKQIRVDLNLPNNSQALRYLIDEYEKGLGLAKTIEGLVKELKGYVKLNNEMEGQLKEFSLIEPLCIEKPVAKIKGSDNEQSS